MVRLELEVNTIYIYVQGSKEMGKVVKGLIEAASVLKGKMCKEGWQMVDVVVELTSIFKS